MLPTQQGAFRLFRLFGVNVSVHWSWFVYAMWRVQSGAAGSGYAKPIFYVAEFLAIFLIVLMHEFGHSLSCRQVGGRADQIVLWPLGGVAYVMPPDRPGAQLWSIAAGPLVNVILIPILFGLTILAQTAGWFTTMPDLARLIEMVFWINNVILVFNLLPIYPFDGGQILRSVLWFIIGRGRSLLVASGLGFVGAAALGLLALSQQSIWFGLFSVLVIMQCVPAWKHARALRKMETAPRRTDFSCPSCRVSPLSGDFWICARCQRPFDMFGQAGVCPNCQAHYEEARCNECGAWAPVAAWMREFPSLRRQDPAPGPAPRR
jgi:Zn-dependent protease